MCICSCVVPVSISVHPLQDRENDKIKMDVFVLVGISPCVALHCTYQWQDREALCEKKYPFFFSILYSILHDY